MIEVSIARAFQPSWLLRALALVAQALGVALLLGRREKTKSGSAPLPPAQ